MNKAYRKEVFLLKNIYSLENLKRLSGLWDESNKCKEPIHYTFPSCIRNPSDYTKFWLCFDEANMDIKKLSNSVVIPNSIQEKEDLMDAIIQYARDAALCIQNNPPQKTLNPQELWCITYISIWLSQYFVRVLNYTLNKNENILENIRLYKNKSDRVFQYISVVSTYMLNN